MAVPLLRRSALLGSTLREYAPAPVVSSVAVCTWTSHTGLRGRVSVLPDGCADLMWDGARRADDARRVLEELVAARLPAGHGTDPLVRAAARGLAAPCSSVDDVAAGVGLSARELRRRFHHEVGLGPKHLQRVLRFGRFVRCLGAVAERRTTLARVAVELGYADQAHISRECREMASRSPRALAATWAMHASGTDS